MTIWKMPIDLEQVNDRGKNTMVDHLDIRITDIGDDYLTATMPVDQRTHQPLGILHGGASCVLAETVGSTAANYCVDQVTHYCVGLDINANHVKAVRRGLITGIAKPLHLGRRTHVWEIKIHNDAGQLTCISRLTMAVIER